MNCPQANIKQSVVKLVLIIMPCLLQIGWLGFWPGALGYPTTISILQPYDPVVMGKLLVVVC